jgi:S1-C subfamily serine protease
MSKTRPLIALVALFGTGAWATLTLGGEELSSEAAAARLTKATVTVRMLPAKREHPDQDETAATTEKSGPRSARETVTVCSGTCVGPGLIATFIAPQERVEQGARRFRITLSSGEQAHAVLRVVDHYSGLLLLEIPGAAPPHLETADTAPQVGSMVLTAAAAGVEQPAVSQGIVSGIDRSPGASGLPPLLECDVRTTETSCGAAIVDRQARLLGIVAQAPLATQAGGWTYAVPARHLSRLMAAKADDGKLVVLERRRPLVGLAMGPGARDGTVEVEHVVTGGPADKAGIRRGDVILEADGRKIRSAYQAVDLILNRQPGDKLSLVIAQGEQRKNVDVVLAGQAPVPGAAAENVGPQLKVRVLGRNQIEVEQQVGANAGDASPTLRSQGDELEMLRTQLNAFEKVIARLQAELKQRERQQAETDELVGGLRREVDSLRARLPAERKGAPPAKK